MKSGNKLLWIALLFYLLVLVVRSFLYTYRILNEFSPNRREGKTNTNYCETKTNFSDLAEQRLYNYYKIDLKCKNI